LRSYHPGYRDIRLRDEALAALLDGPDGTCIIDDLTTMDYEEDYIRPNDAAQDGNGIAPPTDTVNEEDPDPEVSAIPDLSAD
jgi:hypothetical protein